MLTGLDPPPHSGLYPDEPDKILVTNVPTGLSLLGYFYLSCTPVSILGLLLGGPIGLFVALFINLLCWLLIALIRVKRSNTEQNGSTPSA